MCKSIWNKSRYKLFISRWGIVIVIEAGYQILSEIEYEKLQIASKENYIKITDNLYAFFDLKPYPASQQLTAEERNRVCDGLKYVCDQILQSLQNRRCRVILRSFRFLDCDIQDEAFTACAIQWASETFGFPMPEINVRFDREQPPCGKYVFDFSLLSNM